MPTRNTCLRAIISLTLMLSILIMAPPSADAVQSGRACDQGVRAGAECLIELGSPTEPGPLECPGSPTVLQDGDACFTVVAPEQVCPTNTRPDQTQCRQTVERTETCEDGFTNFDSNCILFGPTALIDTCLEGELVADMCEIAGTAPTAGSDECPVSSTVFDDAGQCYTLVGQTQTCPDGTTEDGDGLCRMLVELTPTFECPEGFRDLEGSCIRFSTPTPEGECLEGTLQGGTICIADVALVEGPGFCPVSTTVMQDGESCFSFVDRNPFACPIGTTLDPNGTDCREPVALVTGPATCEPGYALTTDGTRCVRTEPFVQIEGCVEGDFLPEGRCLVQGGLPVLAPCPVSDTVFLDGPDCHTLVETIEGCPADSALDVASATCRQSVELVPGSLVCLPELRLVDGLCYQVEASVFRCDGLDVTINLRTGDSGIGTEGDDVILGTGNADTIEGRGGNDVICSSGGDDTIDAGAGDDIVYGQAGNDRISGGAGNDLVNGGSGNDMIDAGDGNDLVYGSSGNDRINGGSGIDDVRSGTGDDIIDGGLGNDRLHGGSGNDDISGGADDDRLIGGGDVDTCRGGEGTNSYAASCETQVDGL